MMNKTSLSRDVIDIIIHNSKNEEECLLNLYKAVIKDNWDNIERFKSFPECSKWTAEYIVNGMKNKFNPNKVITLWLNQGFSVHDSLNLNPFTIVVPEDCYILKKKKEVDVNITDSFAQIEIEEFGEQIEYNSSYDEDSFDNEITTKYYNIKT